MLVTILIYVVIANVIGFTLYGLGRLFTRREIKPKKWPPGRHPLLTYLDD